MKLNPDCVRDILLAIEDTVDYYQLFEYTMDEDNHVKIAGYTHGEIVYHIHQCRLAGLLYECSISGNGAYITVEDLTPAGHDFLSNTRKNAVWEKIKEVSEEIGSDSLKSLAAIAGQMIIQLIKNRLPIT